MSLTCGNGHYIGGASSCARCGWTALGGQPYQDNPFDELGPGSSTPFPSDVEEEEPDAPVIRAPVATVRGIVVEGVVVPTRVAGGVLPLRFLMVLAVVVTLVIKGPQVMEAIIEGTVRLALLFIWPLLLLFILFAILGKVLPGGGCLTSVFRFSILGAVLRGPRQRRHSADPDGWDLQLLTPTGLVPVNIAASLSLSGGEEIVIHGPTFNGTKHAWLAMVISPITQTRVGRGVISSIIGLLTVLPGCALLLLNL